MSAEGASVNASRRAPWLSVVIPTIGRESLLLTLDALDEQSPPLLEGVEVIVVGDAYGGVTLNLEGVAEHLRTKRSASRYRFVAFDGGSHCFGQQQRTYGARIARGEYVWWGQDDNVAARGALEAIYDATHTAISPLLLFRWVAPWREIIWRYPTLELGNLDADCVVMRRDVAQKVEWGLRYEGDFDAVREAWECFRRLSPTGGRLS